MTRIVKYRSNPELATEHKDGEVVTVVQPLVHEIFGTIHFAKPVHWTFHFELARAAFEDLERLHGDVLRMVPDSGRSRSILDEPFLQRAYAIVNALVSHTVRAVQHFAQDVEAQQRTQLVGHTATDRIREAARLFSATDYTADANYAGITEVVGVRDALEHPQADNVYNNDDWSRVPLAWGFSQRSIEAWRRFETWFTRLTGDWCTYLASLPPSPATLHVERGIESLAPLKKPPNAPLN